MHKAILAGFLLLMQLFASVSAQDDKYQLCEPSSSEYARILNNHLWEISDGGSRNDTVSALSTAALHLFGANDKTMFADLYEMYQRLNIGYLDGAYRREWNVLLIQRWLAENQADLSSTAELELAPEFTAKVTARDFNADGNNEFVLDIHNVDTVHMYLVVAVDNGRYHIIDPNLPWTGYSPAGRYSVGEGQITEYSFHDINADNIPEWLVLLYDVTGGGPGMGYSDGGRLYILGWRNDTLSYLAYTNRDTPNVVSWDQTLTFYDVETIGDTLPTTVTFDFRNTDDDPALEILQAQHTTNNWGCQRVETKDFDWDATADLYLYHSTEIVYNSETRNCLQQFAEEAMWSGDYTAAIDLFEQALSMPMIGGEESGAREHNQLQNQYLRARLAMAYLFTGKPESAASLLQKLSEESIGDEAVAAYINILHDQQETDQVALCSAAFNVFAQNFPSIVIGGTADAPYFEGSPYDPARVGCDAPTLIRESLDVGKIPVSLSPFDWLQNNGVGIIKTFTADLNQDGNNEVLVWTNVPGVQILFVPNGETYATSLVTLDPYLYADELDTWLLPDEAGLGIATIDTDFVGAYMQPPPWPTIYSLRGGIGGGPVPQCVTGESTKDANTVQVWRLDGTTLTNVLMINTCTDTVATALGTGGQHHITTTYQDYRYTFDAYDVLEEYTFTFIWDNTEGRYVWQSPVTPTPSPTIVPTPTSETSPQRKYYSMSQAFADEAYTAVLDMTPTVLDLAAAEDVDTMLAEMYLRALSLEALGQEDSALAIFISLQTAAPEHIVGKLAMLHYEAKAGS
jgi:tetratricopeptide (TPR) repeat protein